MLNTSTNSIDLSTWSRGYRRLDYTFGTLQLSGIIAPGAVFVVGGPISDATNGNPTYNQSITFNPPLLNSGTTADGTALFNVPAAQTTPTTIPIDAIVYGGANLNNLIDETGLANPPDAPDVSGQSIQRVDFAGPWQVAPVPTPNVSPLAANLLLSEIMYNVTGADTDKEWVGLYNPNPFPADLST